MREFLHTVHAVYIPCVPFAPGPDWTRDVRIRFAPEGWRSFGPSPRPRIRSAPRRARTRMRPLVPLHRVLTEHAVHTVS